MRVGMDSDATVGLHNAKDQFRLISIICILEWIGKVFNFKAYVIKSLWWNGNIMLHRGNQDTNSCFKIKFSCRGNLCLGAWSLSPFWCATSRGQYSSSILRLVPCQANDYHYKAIFLCRTIWQLLCVQLFCDGIPIKYTTT